MPGNRWFEGPYKKKLIMKDTKKSKPDNKIRKVLMDILNDSINSLNVEIEQKKKQKKQAA